MKFKSLGIEFQLQQESREKNCVLQMCESFMSVHACVRVCACECELACCDLGTTLMWVHVSGCGCAQLAPWSVRDSLREEVNSWKQPFLRKSCESFHFSQQNRKISNNRSLQKTRSTQNNFVSKSECFSAKKFLRNRVFGSRWCEARDSFVLFCCVCWSRV